jgi:riboflavin synthase alpha subunit
VSCDAIIAKSKLGSKRSGEPINGELDIIKDMIEKLQKVEKKLLKYSKIN